MNTTELVVEIRPEKNSGRTGFESMTFAICELVNWKGIFSFIFGSWKMVFLTNESANKAEINILSARDTTRPGP